MGSLPLLSPDEGRNAEVAREMKASGAWLVPTYNGLPYLDKPAFYFKLVALSLTAFGDTELAARLPSALFGMAVLALVWGFTRRECGDRPAALAVLVITTTPLFISQARIVIFDIALCFFVVLAILAGYHAERTGLLHRRRWLLLSAAAAGMATLVKGPVGLLLPLIILITFHSLERRWAAIRRLFHPLPMLVFLALVLPWFIGVTWQHADFPDYGLVQESFKRFTTSQFHRSGPVYFYALVLPATFFPWSLLLPGAIRVALSRWSTLPDVSRLCIGWCVSVVLFFTLSQSKLPGYILSVTVPFGILTAQMLDSALTRPGGTAARILRTGTWVLVGLGALVLIALIVVAPQTGLLPQPLRLPRVDLAKFSPSVMPVLFLVLLVSLVGGGSLFQRKAWWSVVSFALLPILLVGVGAGVFATLYEERSARPVAARLSHLSPDTELVFYRCFPNGLPFYLGRTGTLITAEGNELTSNYAIYRLARSPQWPSTVIPVSQFDDWLKNQKGSLYLIANENERKRLTDLATQGGATVEELPRHLLGVWLKKTR